MQEGSLALRHEEVDLRQAAAAAADWIRGSAGPDHQLILLAPEQPVVVSADRRRLTTILHGLLDNAIKYSPQGGEVVCEVSSSDGRAQVMVQDRGLGMDAAQLDQLFQPFGRIVTDWTGPTGTIRRRRLRMRAPICIGDTIRTRSRVEARHREGAEEIVDVRVEVRAEHGLGAEALVTCALGER